MAWAGHSWPRQEAADPAGPRIRAPHLCLLSSSERWEVDMELGRIGIWSGQFYGERAEVVDAAADERILADLGPRRLELARERSVGAHPYLGTPEHTRRAREVIGGGRLLAPEQAVVLESDPDRARAAATEHLASYLRAPNYTSN